MMRVRDEEETLEQSIRSLAEHLTIPYEIVLILHLCTDRSTQIATRLSTEFPTLRVLHYSTPISRAGYETLATDATSPHSLPTYYTWCHQQCRLPWIFKWDGDFRASLGLIHFLNGRSWEEPVGEQFTIKICAKNHDSNNIEPYLTSALSRYVKCWFWETPRYQYSYTTIVAPTDAIIEHCSSLSVLKRYWSCPPWYETEDSEEARIVKGRMARLIADFGQEPVGLARASNPICDAICRRMMVAKPDYVNPTA